MIAYPYGALFVGIVLVIASVMLVCRHWLLEQRDDYPKAPALMLRFEWAFAMTLLYAGIHFLAVFVTHRPDTIPPQPAPMTQFLAFAIAVRETVLLLNIVRQHNGKRIPR